MRKAIVGLFTTLIALIVSTTVLTFAWYGSSNKLRIDTFTLQFSGEGAIYIGADPSKTPDKAELKYEELKQTGEFVPVSAMLASSWMKAKQQSPTFFNNYTTADAKFIETKSGKYVQPCETIATEGFYSQDIYLYSPSSYTAVIDSEKTFIKPNLEKNKAMAKKIKEERIDPRTQEEILEELNKIVESTRISILTLHEDRYSYSIIDPNKNMEELVRYGGLLDSDLSREYDYLTDENKDRYEILFGEVNDRSLIKYKEKTESSILPVGEPTWYNSGHAKNCYPIDLENSVGLEIKEEPSLSLEENKDYLNNVSSLTTEEKNKLTLIPINASQTTHIVVSIYLEGWDNDNINDTMAASFDCNINFKTMDRHII